MKISAIAIIPARYASQRLPHKPLLNIAGIPLICRVYQAVTATQLFRRVIVATDDERIMKTVTDYGGEAMMTPENCLSGTDRVIIAVTGEKGQSSAPADVRTEQSLPLCLGRGACAQDYDIVVNVQGDEPFIGRDELQKLLASFDDSTVQIASLMHPISNDEDITNPNVVKVVVDNDNYALYFSRAAIPFIRDDDVDAQLNVRTGHRACPHFKHIGVYAFRKETLKLYSTFNQGLLEKAEKLEQLRWLENGYRIKMIQTSYEGFGIDTREDLIKAETMFNSS